MDIAIPSALTDVRWSCIEHAQDCDEGSNSAIHTHLVLTPSAKADYLISGTVAADDGDGTIDLSAAVNALGSSIDTDDRVYIDIFRDGFDGD